MVPSLLEAILQYNRNNKLPLPISLYSVILNAFEKMLVVPHETEHASFTL